MPIPGPLWAPQDEQELLTAANNGNLVEGHYLDIKGELEPGQAANKEAAKDIASFTLDGGVIIYGVDEQPPAAPKLDPIPLEGLSERIENIARTRISEPLSVRTTEILSATTSGKGYLVVHVPKSPRAPHMVDYRYWGRDEKTKRELHNQEVVLLIEKRTTIQRDIGVVAQEELAEAHKRREGPPVAMVVVVAEPLGARDDLLVDLSAAGEGALPKMRGLVRQAVIDDHQEFYASASGANMYRRRARAVALTGGMQHGDTFQWPYSVELVFREDGRLVLASRGVVTLADFPNLVPQMEKTKVIDELLIVGHVDLMVRLAAAVSRDYHFPGSWRFAVAAGRGLGGSRSRLLTNKRYGGTGGPYTDDTYTQATSATLEDLTQAPHRVVESLTGPLLRALDSHEHISWLYPK